MNKGSHLSSIILIVLTAVLSISILPIINKKKKPGEPNYLSLWNPAEKRYFEKSQRKLSYSGEYIPVIETNNAQELGKLAALSFLHWAKDHPQGVAALPTGKMPRVFIEKLAYYKNHWQDPFVQNDLKRHGISLKQFPDMSGIKIVQLHEFYPMAEGQKNSFSAYIKQHYLSLLGIPEENFLAMDFSSLGLLKEKGTEAIFPNREVDLTLISREPITSREALQKQALLEACQFCEKYENTIQGWGGIGFLLASIGTHGNIAYNIAGSGLNSKTRLIKLSWPAKVEAAYDLGGIDYVKSGTGATVGLRTIRYNKNATVILMATGSAYADAIADAVQNKKSPLHPATAFHGMEGARVYITKGASLKLDARKLEDIQKLRFSQIPDEDVDGIVIELALKEGKRIVDLTKSDFYRYPKSALLIRKYRGDSRVLLNNVRTRLADKIERGLHLPQNTTVLHTAPHHDDILLSYHPVMRKMLKSNVNYFSYLTSGFNSVTKEYILKTLNRIPENSLLSYSPEILRHDYAFLLRRYINAAENKDLPSMQRTESIILLKNMCRLWSIKTIEDLKSKVQWLKREYFASHPKGEKDIREIQVLKGSMRESEADRMLLMAGVSLPRIHHMRTRFYTGDYFSAQPSIEEDAKPFLSLCVKLDPQIITAAFDPEGSGPDTHYKVLQVIAQALRSNKINPQIKVWGYRNIWHKFSFSEAHILSPVSEEDFKKMNLAFLTCFSTQCKPAYPSFDYDGPFSEIAEKIQRQQFEELKTLLGEAFFNRHTSPEIRSAAGFVMFNEMSIKQFCQNAENLKKYVEGISAKHTPSKSMQPFSATQGF